MPEERPITMSPGGLPSTVLPPADRDAEERLAAAVLEAPETRRNSIARVIADHPRFMAGWAALGDAAGDTIERYAAYRVGYHRGLDALRANGWRGSGYVRWAEPTNVGFLRCLQGLQEMAAAIGEVDEAERTVPAATRPIGPTRVTGTSVGGAVLCGGRSVRFGRDKALIVIDGQSMAERVAGVVASAGCAPVVFAGGNPAGLGAPIGRQRIADTWPGEGPLGAVIDVLRWFRHGSAEGVVVAACDLPRLSVDAVRAVASEPGAAVAVADRLHPGLARWPVSAADDLEQLFIGGMRSLHEALRVLGATHVSVPAEALHNVNRPADLAD